MKVRIIDIVSLILGALSICCLVNGAVSLGLAFMFALLALNGWNRIYQNSKSHSKE